MEPSACSAIVTLIGSLELTTMHGGCCSAAEASAFTAETAVSCFAVVTSMASMREHMFCFANSEVGFSTETTTASAPRFGRLFG